jgi:hypothetical protein
MASVQQQTIGENELERRDIYPGVGCSVFVKDLPSGLSHISFTVESLNDEDQTANSRTAML